MEKWIGTAGDSNRGRGTFVVVADWVEGRWASARDHVRPGRGRPGRSAASTRPGERAAVAVTRVDGRDMVPTVSDARPPTRLTALALA